MIGTNGKVIKGIVEETGCKIEVEDDGTVRIISDDDLAIGTAITRIIEAIS
jgi:polyribonucleotide nucleotidyltransferase